MTLDFTCQSCDATFEVELSDLIEEAVVECPSCEARAPRAPLEGMLSALDDLFTQLALLRRRFAITAELDTEDLPAAYEIEGGRTREPAGDDDEELEAPEVDEELEDGEEPGEDEDEEDADR